MMQTRRTLLKDHPVTFKLLGGTLGVPHTEKRAFSALHTTLRIPEVLAKFLQISFAKGKRVPLMKSAKLLSCTQTGAQRRVGVSTVPQPRRGSRSQAGLITVKVLECCCWNY